MARGIGFVCVNDRDRATGMVQQGAADRTEQCPTDRTEAATACHDHLRIPGRHDEARSNVVVEHLCLDHRHLPVADVGREDLLCLFDGVHSVLLLPLRETRPQISDWPGDDHRGDDVHERDIRLTQQGLAGRPPHGCIRLR